MRLTRRHVLLGAAATGTAALGVPAFAAATTTAQASATIENSAYSWWGQPLAVNDGSHTWVSGVGRQGTQILFKVNAETGETENVELSRDVYPADDHNTPAIAYHPDQPHLVVFYTGHNDDPFLRYRTVDRSTLERGDEQTLEFEGDISYAQVLCYEERLVVITRVNATQWWYRISDDFGASWGPARMLLNAGNSGQAYGLVKPIGDGSQALLAFYGHPTMSSHREVDIAKIDMETLHVEGFAGNFLGDLFEGEGPAFGHGKLDTAIVPSGNHIVRLLDLGTINGWPAICYAVWNGGENPAKYRVKLYRDGEFVSPPWSQDTGDPFGHDLKTKYIGGLVIGGDDRLYSSRKDGDGVWHIEKWHWSESDEDFIEEDSLAKDDEYPLVRPYAVVNDGGTELVYQRLNHYDGFKDYDIDTLML